MNNSALTIDTVQEYYGKTLKTNGDLKTSACCSIESIPEHHKAILKLIDNEILERFYGCGSPLPPCLKDQKVLDLGCGTGRDAYLTSYLVGENGNVIGVDMTDEQLDVARRHITSHTNKFGFSKENIDFRKGFIEDLKSVDIADNSVDIVISNCVINLSSDKNAVFKEIFRVLKPGGELYFSDIFSSRRVPSELRADPVLYGECLGGALYIEDFRRMLRKLGCLDYRVMNTTRIELENDKLTCLAGMIDFCSITVRAFKLNSLEDICEDYGQTAIYKGTIEEFPHAFSLDDHHVFKTGMPKLVCGNTAGMLQDTRFGCHFQIIGDRSIHYGAFDCGSPAAGPAAIQTGSCC
jgi:arsenite methyltransferase